jgi:DNA-binding beta-propeller fold protein YncE
MRTPPRRITARPAVAHKMNVRALHLQLLIACVLAFALALAGPALAARSHVFEKPFGEPCTTTPCGNGQFNEPSGVAVNEATGDVYVVDKGNNRVEWFNSTGTFEGQFNGGGLLPNEGLTKPPVPLEKPEGVAIDNTCHLHEQTTGKPLSGEECKALDPSNGDVYVVDTGHDVIDKFSLTGAYIGQLAESGAGSLFGALEGVAVDREGKVWVYQQSGQIDSFSDALANEFQASRSSPFGETGPGFAVDSEDNLYVHRGEGRFAKISSQGQELIESVDEEESTAAAVDLSSNDGSSNDVYIDNVTTVAKFNTTGSKSTLIERFGSGHLTSGSGIAVSSTSGDIYVANAATDAVDIFILPPTPPTIDSTSTGSVTSESADLRASINPNGEGTTYHFEYGTSTSYGASTPEVDIGSGQTDQTVTQVVTGLRPNTTYHFRVVAHNITGTETGHDDTFVYDMAIGGLPDGRAYEMVTPVEKAGSVVGGDAIAADGSSLVGYSEAAFAGLTDGELAPGTAAYYRFTRTSSGWTTTPLTCCGLQGVSVGVNDSVWHPAQVDSGVDHLFLGSADGSMSDIGPVWPPALGREGLPESVYSVEGAASDASHGVVFTITKPFLLWPFDTTKAVGFTSSLYEYTGTENSTPTLVGVSGGPGSTTLIGQCGTSLGPSAEVFSGSHYNSVSESGQTVFFTVTGADHNNCGGTQRPVNELFARVGGSQTVAVSEPSTADCSACNTATPMDAIFEGASADGSKVFFTTTQQLTNSDTDTTRDLYEYDFNAPAGQRLIQVSAGGTGDATPGAGADVGGVSRISEDGSHVYFVANGVLTTSPSPGAQGYGAHGEAVSSGAVAQAGAENLYVFDTETKQTAFIAELCSGPGASGGVADVQCPSNLNSDPWNYGANHNDQALWSHGAEGGDKRPVQSTPDGGFLAFTSYGDLTADDTSITRQVFQYDAQTGMLVRVSIGQDGFHDNGNANAGDARIVGQPYTTTTRGGEIARTMSDDGSYVFFESPVGLTPHALDDVAIDSEGDFAQNVYEYHEGHVSLISDGKDTSFIPSVSGQSQKSGVFLIGTSASGGDVFFTTADPLVPQDTDTQVDIYDARIGGGFPAPNLPPACQGDACQAPPSTPPLFGAPSSASFSGAGNLPPSPPSLVTKPKAKPLTRAQKLAKALKACRAKHNKHQRAVCEAQVRKKYGPMHKAKKANRRVK